MVYIEDTIGQFPMDDWNLGNTTYGSHRLSELTSQ
jgi:hypothetical protein